MAEMLLNALPNNDALSQKTKDNNVPLHYLCKHDLLDAMKLLLQRGAQYWGARVQNDDNKTPLTLATGSCKKELESREAKRLEKSNEIRKQAKQEEKSVEMMKISQKTKDFTDERKITDLIAQL